MINRPMKSQSDIRVTVGHVTMHEVCVAMTTLDRLVWLARVAVSIYFNPFNICFVLMILCPVLHLTSFDHVS